MLDGDDFTIVPPTSHNEYHRQTEQDWLQKRQTRNICHVTDDLLKMVTLVWWLAAVADGYSSWFERLTCEKLPFSTNSAGDFTVPNANQITLSN